MVHSGEKLYRTDSNENQDDNRKRNNKVLDNVFSLADLSIGKVDASKSNASEVLQDSNVIFSGIPVNIVKGSVGAAENDGKFDFF